MDNPYIPMLIYVNSQNCRRLSDFVENRDAVKVTEFLEEFPDEEREIYLEYLLAEPFAWELLQREEAFRSQINWKEITSCPSQEFINSFDICNINSLIDFLVSFPLEDLERQVFSQFSKRLCQIQSSMMDIRSQMLFYKLEERLESYFIVDGKFILNLSEADLKKANGVYSKYDTEYYETGGYSRFKRC